MNYPNGIKKQATVNKHRNQQLSYSNRGMSLEEDINATNEYYLHTNKAIVHKL